MSLRNKKPSSELGFLCGPFGPDSLNVEFNYNNNKAPDYRASTPTRRLTAVADN